MNHNSTSQRQVFAASSELLGEAFYSFLTAPALVYVVYLAFGLLQPKRCGYCSGLPLPLS